MPSQGMSIASSSEFLTKRIYVLNFLHNVEEVQYVETLYSLPLSAIISKLIPEIKFEMNSFKSVGSLFLEIFIALLINDLFT